MVDQIKAYTRDLEKKVRERTKELEDQSVLLKEARDEAEEASREKSEILDNVMESIHYARTIQQAILTDEAHLRRIVPESFVLWEPKDVISGDMVWSKTYERRLCPCCYGLHRARGSGRGDDHGCRVLP